MSNTSLDKRGYVASASDIKDLMVHRMHAISQADGTATTYLRALIATAQSRLQITYSAKRDRFSKRFDNTSHLEMLKIVQGEFYDVLTKVTSSTESDKLAVHRACAFARSAYSTVRSWLLLARKGLHQLSAISTTKHGLAKETPKRKVKSNMARKRFNKEVAKKRTEELIASILAAAAYNREEAIAAMHDAAVLISRGFDELGLSASKLREEIEHTAAAPIRVRRAA